VGTRKGETRKSWKQLAPQRLIGAARDGHRSTHSGKQKHWGGGYVSGRLSTSGGVAGSQHQTTHSACHRSSSIRCPPALQMMQWGPATSAMRLRPSWVWTSFLLL